MESPNGSDSPPHPQVEKKRLNRAPSPARPVLRDVHFRSAKQIVPKSPKFAKQAASQTRVPRRAAPAAKDKPAPAKITVKPSAAKKAGKVTQHAPPEPKPAHQVDRIKGRVAAGSPILVPTGRGDSSSDLSDCPSDERRRVQAASSDAESGSSECAEQVRAEAAGTRTASPGPGKAQRSAGGKDVFREDMLREIEELRSENDYLKVRRIMEYRGICM